MTQTPNPIVWEEYFPPVYGHTSIACLKNCLGFEAAKRGDLSAAISVVKNCVKPERILRLRSCYPYAVLLPVKSQNMLAQALAMEIGMETHIGVSKRQVPARKTLSAAQRMLLKPDFYGNITRGEHYIIVDDIVTQGGTVSALRKFVISHGGLVDAVAALAVSTDSAALAPCTQDVFELLYKFPRTFIDETIRTYNIAGDLGELTRSQMRYFLRFKDAQSITRKLDSVFRTENAN